MPLLTPELFTMCDGPGLRRDLREDRSRADSTHLFLSPDIQWKNTARAEKLLKRHQSVVASDAMLPERHCAGATESRPMSAAESLS